MDNEKKMPLNDLIRSTMDKVHEMADTNTIVGQPISTADGVTLIPIQGQRRLWRWRRRLRKTGAEQFRRRCGSWYED